jgi:hypothetical protein
MLPAPLRRAGPRGLLVLRRFWIHQSIRQVTGGAGLWLVGNSIYLLVT